MPPPGSIHIVANRLPISRSKTKSGTTWTLSPGGLASALSPVVAETGGTWFGWHGGVGAADVPDRHENIELQSVEISKGELDRYYHGFSNRTLWPLYHDVLRTPEFHRTWWRTYVQINERFADAVCAVHKDGDRIWVHDYQLQLVPEMIRQRLPGARVGFFLHIPFPPVELLSRLPWRKQILHGVLGADLAGFQDGHSAENFMRAAQRFASAAATGAGLAIGDREIRVGSFPISIDTERFESLAASRAVQRKAEKLRARLGHRKIVLGVDRLDYTKGIDVRLRAIEEVLRRGRFALEDFAFVQIAVPSREDVKEYRQMRSQIEEAVGRVNGRFAQTGMVAVHYLRRSLPPEELVAYYLAADVMLVTPLRDGMNLVAKEYVATRLDDTGVLVLSEFAGSARRLRGAVLVNPFDIDGIAMAVESALRMPEQEIRRRMACLRREVREQDVFTWAKSFIDCIGGPRAAEQAPASVLAAGGSSMDPTSPCPEAPLLTGPPG